MVSSDLVYDATEEEVWYADERTRFTGETSDIFGGMAGVDKEAVAIERRDRTRSKGYVEQTEVIPASAPLASRLGVSSSLDPCLVNHYETL